LVKDVFTGATDGAITSNGNIRIYGEKLKIAPDDEEGLGVFFVAVADGEVIPSTHLLLQNYPKELVVQVPNLPAGQYALQIVTRYAHSNILLVKPRTIEYSILLTV
jgi:hypothetical protein